MRVGALHVARIDCDVSVEVSEKLAAADADLAMAVGPNTPSQKISTCRDRGSSTTRGRSTVES
jgi:hypothetical protein